jgi:hypothetical protein
MLYLFEKHELKLNYEEFIIEYNEIYHSLNFPIYDILNWKILEDNNYIKKENINESIENFKSIFIKKIIPSLHPLISLVGHNFGFFITLCGIIFVASEEIFLFPKFLLNYKKKIYPAIAIFTLISLPCFFKKIHNNNNTLKLMNKYSKLKEINTIINK